MGKVMTNFLQNMAGMSGMTDQVIATDFFISAKSGVRNIAFAITETATPELKAALREQLRAAVETHEAISVYMVEKKYYHPYNLNEQRQVDIIAAKDSLELSQQ
jgi:similar to spore coat protein